MHITLEPEVVSGNDVLTVEGLSKSFDGHTLFANLDFEVKRGERVAIIGNNGTGKTTILKIINGLVSSRTPVPLRLGLARSISAITTRSITCSTWKKHLFEEISDAYPDLTNTEIRSCPGRFSLYRG